jgi:hypothetical protein
MREAGVEELSAVVPAAVAAAVHAALQTPPRPGRGGAGRGRFEDQEDEGG